MSVTVFSTPTCPWCTKLKEWLKKHNIEFKDIDVSVNQKKAKYMVEKTRQMGVPVTEVDGKFVVGFDVEKLKQLLGIKE